MATLLKSLHKIPSVLQSNAAVVEKINSAQSQVIQEGTINPESRVSFMTVFNFQTLIYCNLCFVVHLEVIERLLHNS